MGGSTSILVLVLAPAAHGEFSGYSNVSAALAGRNWRLRKLGACELGEKHTTQTGADPGRRVEGGGAGVGMEMLEYGESLC